MSKYEKELVDFKSLQVGDVFQHPHRDDAICKVEHSHLQRDEFVEVKAVMYSIVEGVLHWPVIYLPPNTQITLLLPTTTYVKLPGKEWLSSLTEHHGVSK